MKTWGKPDRLGEVSEQIVFQHIKRKYPQAILCFPEPGRAHHVDAVLTFADREPAVCEVKYKASPTKHGTYGLDRPDFETYSKQGSRLIIFVVDRSKQAIFWLNLNNEVTDSQVLDCGAMTYLPVSLFQKFAELSQADLDLLRKAEQQPVRRRSLAGEVKRCCSGLRKAISSSRGGVAYGRSEQFHRS